MRRSGLSSPALARQVARAAVRIASLETRTRRLRPRAAPGPVGSPAATFAVYTFVTDDRLYDELKASFSAAGFEAPLAHFVELRDRRTPGGTDPYELITHIGADRERPYVVLVHQDVRTDRGAGAHDLLAELDRLDALDPGWVVAGNAGGAHDLHLIRRLRDPYGGSTHDALPARVASLDENFLVFNPRARPRCSPGLDGFHLYGTDTCLNAARDGGTAYVIDFLVTHLSGGDRGGAAYAAAKERFLAAWHPRTLFTLVRAPTELLFMSRWAVLRRLIGSPQMLERIQEIVPSLRLDTD